MNLLPVIVKRRPGHVELSIAPLSRILYIAFGGVLLVLLARGSSPQLFVYICAALIALGALSEDRWTFDAAAKEVRRRYGLLIFVKSWAIDSTEVTSIELDADSEGMSSKDPFATVPTMNWSKGVSSLRLVFYDGRSMTICAASRKRLEALRARGAAIAEALGCPLVES